MNISADTMNGTLLSTGYSQTAGVYDEMSAAPGVLRPHWDVFINSLSALGAQELRRRWQTASLHTDCPGRNLDGWKLRSQYRHWRMPISAVVALEGHDSQPREI